MNKRMVRRLEEILYPWETLDDLPGILDRAAEQARTRAVPEALGNIAELRKLLAAWKGGPIIDVLCPPGVNPGDLRVRHVPDCPRYENGCCLDACAVLRAA